MTDPLLWTLIAVQIAMGAFDTLYHHEMMERLAWRESQSRELQLHGVRNLFYALVFFVLGWTQPHGWWAIALGVILVAELGITLWDFVEEDLTRNLPASERINHTLLTLNYGAILILAAPVLLDWASRATSISGAFYGWWSWMAAVSAVAVAVFGVRDLFAAKRIARISLAPAAALVDALGPVSSLGRGRKTILVLGGTGFVGTRLVDALTAAGHDVTVYTRKKSSAAALAAPVRIITSLDQIPTDYWFQVVVDLAGEPVAGGLWTKARRIEILRSRVKSSHNVAALLKRLFHRPEVVINASAIGWYGLRGDEVLTEASAGRACFVRRVCVARERAAARIEDLGVRVVNLRIGLVLGKEGGMLAKLLLPFEFGLGGPTGAGRQWMSWISRDDCVRLIAHAIATPSLRGPLNAVAPNPVRNTDFAKALGSALGRPALLRLPTWPLRLVLRDFADELLLSGQLVLPAKALGSGFVFANPHLEPTLRKIVGSYAAETQSVDEVRVANDTPERAIARYRTSFWAHPGDAPLFKIFRKGPV